MNLFRNWVFTDVIKLRISDWDCLSYRMGAKFSDCCSYKRKEMGIWDPERHREKKYVKTGGGWSYAAVNQWVLGATGSWRSEGAQSCQQLVFWLLVTGTEKMNASCFELPSFWYQLVLRTLGNEYTPYSSFCFFWPYVPNTAWGIKNSTYILQNWHVSKRSWLLHTPKRKVRCFVVVCLSPTSPRV